MATEAADPAADRIHKALEDLEAEKTLISSCTQQWRSLADHFSSLEQTLADRSQALDSKIQALDSETQQSLETLDRREAAIPDRELAAAALIEERRGNAVSEMEDPDFKPPEDVEGFLRLYCRRMDSARMWRFVVSRRKGLGRGKAVAAVAEALAEAVDPRRLVLDAVDDFLAPTDDPVAPDGLWALGVLTRSLLEEAEKPTEAPESIRERAVIVAEKLKEKFEGKGEGGVMGGQEVQTFLQFLVAFGLGPKFDQEFLKKLVVEHASRKDMPKLAAGLGFGEKTADIIDELVKTSKEIEAVYFAHEAGFTERFPPTPLIKSYLHRSRRNATTVWKAGNLSTAATEESSNLELIAMRSTIKCVETLKLEQEYPLAVLKKRLSQLEKTKADRRKTPASKSQFKRTRAGAGTSSSRPAKALRTSDRPYPSFRRNPTTTDQIPGPHHSYNYQGQVGFDAPAASMLVAAHGRNPAHVPQQYYLPDDMAVSRGGMSYSGASVGYAGLDYAAPRTASVQPSYPY